LSQAKATITYTPRPDATPESELDALARVYRFVIGRHAAKTAAAEGFRLRLEGGADGTLTNDPNKQVASSRVEENSSS
jgi:hypothetical protein